MRIKRKTAPFYGDKYLFTFYSRNEIKKILSKNFRKVNIEIHRELTEIAKNFEFFVLYRK